MRFVVGPALKIEHMGSTSVSGLSAKPIIDILVGLPNLLRAKSTFVRPFAQLGYTYIPEYEAWLPGELFFRKRMPGPWTHHLHIMEQCNPRWRDFLLFRDYLRLHPEIAAAYGSQKKSLADEFGKNIEGFRKTKHRL
nr:MULTISPECIES: GrpB family protein [unclassified Bradyrhizobium]